MIKYIFLPLALFATSQAAMAQADPERLGSLPEQELEDAQLDSIFRHYELQEVVVTGTRTPKFLKDTPIQTRVISSRDIARTDATNVQDLLQQELPGVEFSYSMNQQTHLNFAGFGGQGILFLVDGERLAGESMDDVDFSRLLVSGVERIEIVKGASSALYGSSATGGVVNIITKNATEPWTLNVNARYAKHNDQRYGGMFALRSKHWSNAFSANYHNKDNYNVTSAPNPVTRVISTIYGERTVDFKDKLTWRPSDRLSVGARAGYFFRETTRTVNLPERYRDFSGGLRLDWLISKDDNLQANYSFDQYDKSDYQQLRHLDIRDYSNVQNTFRLLYSHAFGETATLTAGADYMHDYLYNTYLAGDAREQDCYDVFAQYDWNITDKLEAVAAVRYDYFSDRQNSQFTPKLNLRYKPNRRLVLRAGYGMGFRAPSLKERYYNFDMAGIWIIEGNEHLKAEKSHNFTLSAEYSRANCSLAVSAFYNNVSNKISTSAPYFKSIEDKLPYLPYTNLANYRVFGADVSMQARWQNGISARLSYAHTKERLPKDKEGNTINNQYIPARAHALNASVDYDHQFTKRYGIYVSLNGRLLSGTENVEFKNYYDVTEGTVKVEYPAYTTWKLSLTQRVGKAVSITTALDNLFNYRPKFYYLNAPLTDGITFQVGVAVDVDKLF